MGLSELVEVVLHKVFQKVFSEDTVNALDVQKWGTPITRGESHFINDQVSERYYEGIQRREEAPGSIHGALWLSNIYEYYLQDQFGFFRRGWVIEYMGDAFCPNAFQRFMFVAVARVPILRGVLLNIQRSLQRISQSEEPTPPADMKGEIAAVGWTTATFYLGTIVAGTVLGGAFFSDPVGFLVTYPLVLGGFLFAFSSWYGKYDMWLPVAGVQTVGSALAYIGLWVTSIALLIRGVSRLPGGAIIESIAVEGMTLGGTYLPNPLFLGLGHVLEGFIRGSGTLGILLLLWGLSGVANIFYAELEEAHTEKAKQAKRVADLVAEKVARSGGG